jgi:hypothetical protein
MNVTTKRVELKRGTFTVYVVPENNEIQLEEDFMEMGEWRGSEVEDAIAILTEAHILLQGKE